MAHPKTISRDKLSYARKHFKVDKSVPPGEIKIKQSDPRERTPGTIKEYRKQVLGETDPTPKWRTLDLTEFIAAPIQNAKDDIADAVDTFVAALEFVKEVLDLYATIATFIISPLVAAVEAIRKILKDLLALINLSDAGLYVLYIPFKKGGSAYYAETFDESLSDNRDSMRPQMGDNSYCSALFLKAGAPEFKLDGILDNFWALKSQFFGVMDRAEDFGPLPLPQDFVVKPVMMPIYKVKELNHDIDRTYMKSQTKFENTEEPLINRFFTQKLDSVRSYTTSELKLSANAPALTANLTWKTPQQWMPRLTATAIQFKEGKSLHIGEGKGRRVDIYTRTTSSIKSIFVVQSKVYKDLSSEGIIRDKIKEMIQGKKYGQYTTIDGGPTIFRVKAYPYRDFYHDDTMIPPITEKGVTRYDTYYYRVCYGYTSTRQERVETWEGDIYSEFGKYALSGERKIEVKELTDDGETLTINKELYNKTNKNDLTFYGKTRQERDGEERSGPFSRIDSLENRTLASDESGKPPDWVSYRFLSELFPPIQAVLIELETLIDNIADSIIGTSKAMLEAVLKTVDEIQDLIDAAIRIAKLFNLLLIPPIVGVSGMFTESSFGIKGLVKLFKNSLNIEDPPSKERFGSRYLSLDEDTGKYVNAVTRENRYDLVPYFPEHQYCGGLVFMFGSLPAWNVFKQFFGDVAYAKDTWANHMDTGQLGLNNIKIPELVKPIGRSERRRQEASDRSGVEPNALPVDDGEGGLEGESVEDGGFSLHGQPLSGITGSSGTGDLTNQPYGGSDNSEVQRESDIARGVIDKVDNDIDELGRGTYKGANTAPFSPTNNSNTFGFSVNSRPCKAVMPLSGASADLIAGAINAAFLKSFPDLDSTGNGALDDEGLAVARPYGGKILFITPVDGGDITFGYSPYNKVIGVPDGFSVIGLDDGDFETSRTTAFGYKPDDLLLVIANEGGSPRLENISVPAVYKGADVFDDSENQDFSPDKHNLKIIVDTYDLTIDVTGDGGIRPKLAAPSFISADIGAGPYDFTPALVYSDPINKFYLEVTGAGGLLPVGPQLVTLPQLYYQDAGFLMDALHSELNTAGFPPSKLQVSVDGLGKFSFFITDPALFGIGVVLTFTAHADDFLPVVGVTAGGASTEVGTDLIPTYTGVATTAPYDLESTVVSSTERHQFNFEIVGAPIGLGLPTGPNTVTMPRDIPLNDKATLINRLLMAFHAAGFFLGKVGIYEDSSGGLEYKLREDYGLSGSAISFEFTEVAAANALPQLGISDGDGATGTDLVLYTKEEVRDNINAAFLAADAAYTNVCYIRSDILYIKGKVKGYLGLIEIQTEEATDEESSGVATLVFGTENSRGIDVAVSGIGDPFSAINYEIEFTDTDFRDTVIELPAAEYETIVSSPAYELVFNQDVIDVASKTYEIEIESTLYG